MELRQVEHFLAVVDHGSFTAGARAAQIVQSALSTSIRNLERELGAALFERTTRRVSLSEAGRAFLPAARRVVAEATAAADAVRAVAGLRRGRVAVGTIQWLGPVDLPAELAAFHRNNPDIQINVLNAPVSTLLERLRDGELDLAYLVLDAPLPAELVGRLVYQEDLVLITPPGHRLAEQERLRWAELADQPFIEFGEGTALAVIVQRICAELGVARRLVSSVGRPGEPDRPAARPGAQWHRAGYRAENSCRVRQRCRGRRAGGAASVLGSFTGQPRHGAGRSGGGRATGPSQPRRRQFFRTPTRRLGPAAY
jgi:DNA-binding transcriptional LysR family regulator